MAATRVAMRVHFLHRHVHDIVVILEEGNLLLPRCPRCDLQVSRRALNGRHLGTTRHGKAAPRRHLWDPQTSGGPRTYMYSCST